MSYPIDLSQYTPVPVLDTPRAVALAHALLAAAPNPAPEQVEAAADELKAAIDALESAWKARSEPQEKTADARSVDREVDLCWGTLFSRLDALASLPPALYPRAALAATLRDRLFPPSEGLGFLTMRYRSEWAEVKKRLDLVDAADLGPDIKSLAGQEWLAEARRTFAQYGEVLGISQSGSAPAPEPQNLLERIRDVSGAIGAYAIAIFSTVRPQKKETVAAAIAALRPLAEAKARAVGGSSPARPTPPAPPAPPQVTAGGSSGQK